MDQLSKNIPSIVREIKLSYSLPVKASLLPQIHSSSDAYKLLLESWDQDKIEFVEQFKIILLNRRNRVLGICQISEGGQSETVVDPKIVFSCALKANAASIILAHNHPSGNLCPSSCDDALTAKLKNAGKFLDLNIVDHVILTNEGYYSFADEGKV
jgi:DNA repair protein RadC